MELETLSSSKMIFPFPILTVSKWNKPNIVFCCKSAKRDNLPFNPKHVAVVLNEIPAPERDVWRREAPFFLSSLEALEGGVYMSSTYLPNYKLL